MATSVLAAALSRRTEQDFLTRDESKVERDARKGDLRGQPFSQAWEKPIAKREACEEFLLVNDLQQARES